MARGTDAAENTKTTAEPNESAQKQNNEEEEKDEGKRKRKKKNIRRKTTNKTKYNLKRLNKIIKTKEIDSAQHPIMPIIYRCDNEKKK